MKSENKKEYTLNMGMKFHLTTFSFNVYNFFFYTQNYFQTVNKPEKEAA